MPIQQLAAISTYRPTNISTYVSNMGGFDDGCRRLAGYAAGAGIVFEGEIAERALAEALLDEGRLTV